MDNRVYIFDTTLRDGQQSPGAGMTFADNLAYAELAHALAIDVLEAGFPAASQTDFAVVKAIAENMAAKQSPMLIAALCQLREEQFVKTMDALAPGLSQGKARVHTYVPVDPKLMQASLGALAENKQQIVNDLHRLILLATKAGYSVEFSAEGYSRMADNFDFVSDLIRAAVSAGACVINCPDTIGGAARVQGAAYFVEKMQQHANLIAKEFPGQAVMWSVHCHNDLGLALDNSLNGVLYGPARQIEGCINGVGERAGNVSLEQCIIFLKEFGAHANAQAPFYTHIQLDQLQKISDFIADRMLPRQRHWPIVGENAAKHSSGGHTNAVLKDPLAYQPFDPRELGGEITFVYGPLSGSNHARQVILAHDYLCDNDEKVEIAQAIKDYYADRRKGITDEELIQGYLHYRAPIKAQAITYAKLSDKQTSLTLTGQFFDQAQLKIDYHGNESAVAALKQAVDKYYPGLEILEFNSDSGHETGAHAKCHARVKLKTAQNKWYAGQAVDADIEIAALQALIDAINQAYIKEYYYTGSEDG